MDLRRLFRDNAQDFAPSDSLRLMSKRPHFNLASRPGFGVALINRLYAVKTNAVVGTAHE